MYAEIISIGDELLIGKTVNTNAAWMGAILAENNIVVRWNQTISDDRDAILGAVAKAFERSDLILMTGGLGPTKDDITKDVLCDYFNTELVINEEVLVQIRQFFERRSRVMLDVNIQQAALPKACVMIPNSKGTASGMWFEKEGKILVSMPGVPYEMQAIMSEELLPRITDFFQVKSLYHKTILTTGIGESYLADRMEDWENRILNRGFNLAYLPAPGEVKLRISSQKGQGDEAEISNFLSELEETLPLYVYGYEKDSLSGVIGALLLNKKHFVGTVESCTGGALAHEFVRVSGSSAYFYGSLLTYNPEAKTNLAGVPVELTTPEWIVSAETAESMARGGRVRLGVDYCLSTTGIAGPDGGTDENPVGTVWIGLATPTRTLSKRFHFGDDRDRNIHMAVLAAMNLLRIELLGLEY